MSVRKNEIKRIKGDTKKQKDNKKTVSLKQAIKMVLKKLF